MMRSIPFLALALLALATCPLSAQDDSPEGARRDVPLLRDLPVLGGVFRKEAPQDEKAVPTIGDVFDRMKTKDAVRANAARRRSPSAIRAEKRIGETRALTVGADGKIDYPEPEFADDWLRRRVLAIDGVEGAELIDRLTAGLAVRWAQPPGVTRSDEIRSITAERFLIIDARDREALARAEAEIRRFREAERAQVLVEVRMIEANEITGFPDLAVESAATADARLGEITAMKGVEVIAAPQVLFNEGQRASIEIANNVSYIRDYKVEYVRDGAIADPIIDVVKDGIALEFAALRDPDTGRIHLGMQLDRSWLTQPIPEFETTVDVRGHKTDVTIQLPDVHYKSWTSNELVLPGEGGTVFVRPFELGSTPSGRDFVLAAKVRVMEVEGAGARPITAPLIAVDTDRNLAFLQSARGFAVGDEVVFARGDVYRGSGTVREVVGKLVTIAITKGEPEEGDVAQKR
ncbi:MAG: hypothetical protein R3F20_13020 [Planctomycetota bacterium]